MKIILLYTFLAVSTFAEVVPSEKIDNPTCEICKFIVNEIDKVILDGATIDDILAAMEQICGPLDSIIPGATHICELLMETQLPELIDLIVNNNLNPEVFCHSLGLCPAPSYKKALLENV